MSSATTVFSALLIATLLAGCSGRADLTLTELDYRRIVPQARHLPRFQAAECYHHTDEAGDLYLTIHFRNTPLIELLRSDLQISVKLPNADAAVSGNHVVNGAALLGVWHAGPNEYRFRSYRGVVAANARHDGSLTGAIRVSLRLVGQQLLGGWGRPRNFHLVGTFHAVPHPDKGPPIDEECRDGPFDRQTARKPITTNRVIRIRWPKTRNPKPEIRNKSETRIP